MSKLTVLQVFADATLVFPLLVAATFAQDVQQKKDQNN
jgi:deoxyhypusine synthase